MRFGGPRSFFDAGLSSGFAFNTNVELNGCQQVVIEVFKIETDEKKLLRPTGIRRMGFVRTVVYDIWYDRGVGFKEVMSGLANITKEYTEKTLTTLEKINEDYLIGGLQVFTKDRKYVDIIKNWLNQPFFDLLVCFWLKLTIFAWNWGLKNFF